MLYYIKIDNIVSLLEKLKKDSFYGKITLNFEKGKVTYIRKEETIKDIS